MTICERIKLVRKELNMNQTDFGKSLSVSRDTINNYDNGRATPSKIFIDNLCRTYKVNVIWLETGEGEMFQTPSVDEELAVFAGKIIASGDEFKKQVFFALSQMDDAAWEAFQVFYKAMKETEEKEKGTE